MLRLWVWTRYLQVLYDLDRTDRSETKSRSEVAHDKTVIIISYTGKCKTCSTHLPTTTSTTTIATTTSYSMRLLNFESIALLPGLKKWKFSWRHSNSLSLVLTVVEWIGSLATGGLYAIVFNLELSSHQMHKCICVSVYMLGWQLRHVYICYKLLHIHLNNLRSMH